MQEQIWKDEAKEQIEKFYKEREQKLAANKVFSLLNWSILNSIFW